MSKTLQAVRCPLFLWRKGMAGLYNPRSVRRIRRAEHFALEGGKSAYVRTSGSGILGWVKRQLPLRRQAGIAARLLPARFRFRFALAISRVQGRLISRMGGNGALSEAMMRDHWLRELTFHGPFSVPWRLHGREVLDEYAVPGPVLYVTTHIPMGEIPLRVVMELGYPVPVPVADPGRIVDEERYVVAGMAERIPAITAAPHVLARMRTLLARGTSVVCLADREFGAELSANPLRLAGRLGIPVIFVWAELAADRVVDVTFRTAPYPLCANEKEIEENLRELRALNGQVLRSLNVGVGLVETAESDAVGLEQRKTQS